VAAAHLEALADTCDDAAADPTTAADPTRQLLAVVSDGLGELLVWSKAEGLVAEEEELDPAAAAEAQRTRDQQRVAWLTDVAVSSGRKVRGSFDRLFRGSPQGVATPAGPAPPPAQECGTQAYPATGCEREAALGVGAGVVRDGMNRMREAMAAAVSEQATPPPPRLAPDKKTPPPPLPSQLQRSEERKDPPPGAEEEAGEEGLAREHSRLRRETFTEHGGGSFMMSSPPAQAGVEALLEDAAASGPAVIAPEPETPQNLSGPHNWSSGQPPRPTHAAPLPPSLAQNTNRVETAMEAANRRADEQLAARAKWLQQQPAGSTDES
jgi:hypothetical protein